MKTGTGGGNQGLASHGTALALMVPASLTQGMLAIDPLQASTLSARCWLFRWLPPVAVFDARTSRRGKRRCDAYSSQRTHERPVV